MDSIQSTFLSHILHYAKRWLLIWDRSPIRRRVHVRDYIDALPHHQIHVAFRPPYAPDLNPVEWVWGHLEQVEMANLTCVTWKKSTRSSTSLFTESEGSLTRCNRSSPRPDSPHMVRRTPNS